MTAGSPLPNALGIRTNVLALVILFTLLPLLAAAQSPTSGAIAGAVRDTTGAALPNVTVEATSPALIEKTRTVVTDSEGNYRIIDLRPGTYTVTFALSGFAAVRREGIELTTGFTANVSTELGVGELTETISVAAASPVVDVQNSRSQSVVSAELLRTVPSPQTTYALASLTVGAMPAIATGQDVGGSQGEVGGFLSYHGSNSQDGKLKMDGMDYNALLGTGGGSQRVYAANTAAVTEVNLGLGTGDAEHATAGVQLNYVPKEGGNTFSMTAMTVFSTEGMASENLSDDIRRRGLTQGGAVLRSWDNSVTTGGPFKQHKAWFFAAVRFWGNRNRNPDAYYNATQHSPFYTPDRSRPANSDLWQRDVYGRITWQIDARNKVTFAHNEQRSCFCTYIASPTLTPEAFVSYHASPGLTQATWMMPATNRLLFQAGVSYGRMRGSSLPTGDVLPTDIAKVDAGTGVVYGSNAVLNFASGLPYAYDTKSDPLYGRFAVSYVTGSHSFKLGMQAQEGWNRQNGHINLDRQYIFFNRNPILINQFATPLTKEERARSIGLFAQDQWTIDRLTLNLGARFDFHKGWVPAQVVPAGSFVPERRYSGIDNAPSFKDLTPRIGVAYDLFGNGKTALKGSFGLYVSSQGISLTELNNPALLTVTQVNRSWLDANRNFEPDCVLTNFAANGECGAISNNLFGTSVPGTRFDEGIVRGWGARARASQLGVSIQQELGPGWSAMAGYFRTEHAGIAAIENTAVGPGDFTSFCVTAPTDARLPGGGGYQVCGNVDVNPDQFGRVDNLVQKVEKVGAGEVTRVFNGVDLAVNGRFGRGGMLTGGVSIGRTVRNDCALNTAPNALVTGSAWDGLGNYISLSPTRHPLSEPYCHVAPQWSQSMAVKLNGVYPLPYGFEVSGVLQNLPGLAHAANLTYTNAQLAPILGRDLAAGPAGTMVIPILAPETSYEPRLTQVDLRFSRNFRFGRTRVRGLVDVYNAFNESAVTQVNTTYGSRWLEPQRIMFGRLVKLGAQLDF
jgi:hypothetical protein